MSEKQQEQSPSSATNGFDDELRAAQTRSMAAFAAVGAGLALLVLAYLFWLFLTRGYAIEVQPEQAAQQASIEVTQGTAFALSGSVYTLGGGATIRVDAPFYEPETVELDSDSPSTVVVTLKPRPLTLKASTQPISPSTRWLIDGVLVHEGPQLERILKVGEYTLRAENPYYKPVEISVSMGQSEITEVALQFETVPAQLTVASKPVGATIMLDGQQVGQTDATLATVSGEHSLRLELEGYEPIDATVGIGYEQPQLSRSFQLERLKAYLIVRVEPSGGRLVLNGNPIEPGEQTILSETAYQLQYSKPGYLPAQQAIKLKAGQRESVSLTLQPEMGQVTFRSSPAAQVVLNGKEIGEGEVKTSLQTVKQTVEFRKAGYRTVTKTFTPSSKRALLIDVKLLTENQARRAEGGKPVAEQLGMQFVRQRFGSMTMGSPPNERGRMRNEFEYPVRFTRPVLVGRQEVTESQFHAFDSSRPSSSKPVTSVTWNEAALFANWLSAQDGLPAFYQVQGKRVVGFNPSATGYRLLSEAEWEWLAKASKRVSPTPFVWGTQSTPPEGSGNYGALSGYSDSHPGVAPVASYRAERAGIYDLSGNVSEWVNDFESYIAPDGVQTNYMGPRSGSAHVVKGGNFKSNRVADLRAAKRDFESGSSPVIGFRLARYE